MNTGGNIPPKIQANWIHVKKKKPQKPMINKHLYLEGMIGSIYKNWLI